jgi:hypothetical protein
MDDERTGPADSERTGPADSERTGPADSEKTGTFLVTHADEGSAVLRDVEDGQVHTLAAHPGLSPEEVVRATVAPVPPLEVAWEVVEVDERRTVPVEESSESPTRQALNLAADQSAGEVTRRERAGEGELHVLSVPPERTAEAAADVVADEATRSRAARLGVDRVEVRAADGVVSVRYLP